MKYSDSDKLDEYIGTILAVIFGLGMTVIIYGIWHTYG